MLDWNLTTGDDNIDIGNQWLMSAEANTIRIGTDGLQHGDLYHRHLVEQLVYRHSRRCKRSWSTWRRTLFPAVSRKRLSQWTRQAKRSLRSSRSHSATRKEIDPASIPQFGLVAEDVERGALVGGARQEGQALQRALRRGERDVAECVPSKSTRKCRNQRRRSLQLKKDFGVTTAQLTARLDEQASQIQKVSAQLEASRPAPQVVLNNQ